MRFFGQFFTGRNIMSRARSRNSWSSWFRSPRNSGTALGVKFYAYIGGNALYFATGFSSLSN